jgi:YHS domain-containing protein
MFRPKMFLGLLAALLAAACSASPQRPAPTASGVATPAEHHELCPICAWRGDLACVDVLVDDTTPRAEVGGVTYYFCSEECRVRFLKDPERYLR